MFISVIKLFLCVGQVCGIFIAFSDGVGNLVVEVVNLSVSVTKLFLCGVKVCKCFVPLPFGGGEQSL
ncbi:MAG: hypothetical protein H6679_05140 [Epsilonproteobacteria bacterium]|nr:hypothetical protein [Campylobacterota bacterium]MCB9493630.1 hypothetical protein [Campylobacterota bacterium]